MGKTFTCIIASFATFLLSSCNKNELIYSCNPEVDEWTTRSINEIHQMSRSKFLEMDTEYQRAAFRAFTPEQRLNLWITKFNEMMQLDWTDAESEHIQNLISIMAENSVCYDDNRTEEQMDNFSIAIYRWMDYSRESLQWDDTLLAAILTSPSKLLSTNGRLDIRTTPLLKNQSESSSKPDCNCDSENIDTVLSDCRNSNLGACPINYNDKCKPKSWSCGTAWMGVCNSICI